MSKILTVAVPMYNVQKYIKQCLSSFLVEGLEQKIEVLAVDDGSFDRTSEIAQSYARGCPWLFRYIRKENGGHGSAVNTALKHAQGRYFMVVDGDDWAAREDLRTLVTELERFDVDLAVSHYTRVSGGQNNMVVESNAPVYGKVLGFEELNASKYYFVLSSVCYRTSLLWEMKLELPEHTYYDDLVYITEPMLHVKKVVFFDINYYRYRVGLSSQSTAQKNMAIHYKQHRRIVIRILRFFEKHKNNTTQAVYIKHVLGKALKDHYYILLHCEPDIRKARQRLLKMDAVLKKTDKEFMDILAKEILFLGIHRAGRYWLLPVYRRMAALKNSCR